MILPLLAFAFAVIQPVPSATARQVYRWIMAASEKETGLTQLREVNLSVNDLLDRRNMMPEPEHDRWRSVDEILDSDLRNNCKDFVVLKQDLLNQVNIFSRRLLVMVRSRNELHVVLQVHYGDGDLILDNLRSVMVPMADLAAFYEVQNGAP